MANKTGGGSTYEAGISHTGDQPSVFRVKVCGLLKEARILIDRYGKNKVGEIKRKLREHCLKKTVNLYPDRSDSSTPRVTGQLEEPGLFLAGLLPKVLSGGDALLHRYFNNVPVDHDEIRVSPGRVEALVACVRERDPNRP